MPSKRRNLREAQAQTPLDLAVSADDASKNNELPLVMPEKALDLDIDIPEAPPSDAYDKAMRDREWGVRRLVEEYADAARARVCRKVISGLRRIPGMQRVAGWKLATVWDEVCVQMQTEESFYWEIAYIPTIEQLVESEITKLSRRDKQAIWLQTDKGSDWLIGLDLSADGSGSWNDGAGIPYDDYGAGVLILSNVIALAMDYSNSRIRSYVDEVERKDYIVGG